MAARPARLAAWALPLALSAAPGVAGAQGKSLEQSVKGAYLYKFAPFVSWPAEAFPAASAPIIICVLGNDPFGPALDQAISAQRVSGRGFAVRRLSRVTGSEPCQILYLGGASAEVNAQALRAVRGRPVLTVTSHAVGGSARGVVHFVLDRDRVRFHLDLRQARRNGIALSSKLLGVALSVAGTP